MTAVLAAGFVVTVVPFLAWIWKRDPLLGLVALPLSFASAVSAAAGLAGGILHHRILRS